MKNINLNRLKSTLPNGAKLQLNMMDSTLVFKLQVPLPMEEADRIITWQQDILGEELWAALEISSGNRHVLAWEIPLPRGQYKFTGVEPGDIPD